MSGSTGTKLPKLPFYGADIVLSALAAYGLYSLGAIQGPWEAAIAVACIAGGAWGAWLAITPWLREHETSARLAETENLTSAVAEIQNLERVAQTIQNANSNWQLIQDTSAKTVQAAQEISLRMKRETDEFMKFLDQANEQEKAALRLEVQKSRKMEDDWLQVVVRMLDHVYALYSAAARAGQQHLTQQLEQFQYACRDAARRVGLNPFAPNKKELFDARVHQNADQKNAVPEGALISDVIATGYTYQGQLLRRALVRAQEAAREEPQAGSMTESIASEDFGTERSSSRPEPQPHTFPRVASGETTPVEETAPSESPETSSHSAQSVHDEFLDTDPLPDAIETRETEPAPPSTQAPGKSSRPAHPQLPLD